MKTRSFSILSFDSWVSAEEVQKEVVLRESLTQTN